MVMQNWKIFKLFVLKECRLEIKMIRLDKTNQNVKNKSEEHKVPAIGPYDANFVS